MPDRNEHVPHDTEDKLWWCKLGETLEDKFLELCRDHLKLDAVKNPEKITNPMAPDLVVEGLVSDLKTQNTPFFMSSKYGLDPKYAVTFNRKDYERYSKLYPDIVIYFWVNWTQLEYRNLRTDPLHGVFRVPFRELSQLISNGAPEHRYIHRQYDRSGNAKSSFILDLRNFEQLFLIE